MLAETVNYRQIVDRYISLHDKAIENLVREDPSRKPSPDAITKVVRKVTRTISSEIPIPAVMEPLGWVKNTQLGGPATFAPVSSGGWEYTLGFTPFRMVADRRNFAGKVDFCLDERLAYRLLTCDQDICLPSLVTARAIFPSTIYSQRFPLRQLAFGAVPETRNRTEAIVYYIQEPPYSLARETTYQGDPLQTESQRKLMVEAGFSGESDFPESIDFNSVWDRTIASAASRQPFNLADLSII